MKIIKLRELKFQRSIRIRRQTDFNFEAGQYFVEVVAVNLQRSTVRDFSNGPLAVGMAAQVAKDRNAEKGILARSHRWRFGSGVEMYFAKAEGPPHTRLLVYVDHHCGLSKRSLNY